MVDAAIVTFILPELAIVPSQTLSSCLLQKLVGFKVQYSYVTTTGMSQYNHDILGWLSTVYNTTTMVLD